MAAPRTVLEHALALAALGWLVVACKPRSKEVAFGRRLVGSTITRTIEQWWNDDGERNLAVLHGRRSGFFVLDVDPRNGGSESLASLTAANSYLPRTPVARSGGGGLHYFFRFPDCPIRSSKSTVAPGLDILAGGGVVVVEPSVHSEGGLYEWIIAPWHCDLAAAPDWLLELIQTAPKMTGPITQLGANDSRPLLVDSDKIVERTRNRRLFESACSLRARGASEMGVLQEISKANRTRCRPPLAVAEVERIASSACRFPAGTAGAGAVASIPLLVVDELLRRGDPGELHPVGRGWRKTDSAGSVLASYPWVDADTLPMLQRGAALAGGSVADRVVREVVRTLHRQRVDGVRLYDRLTYQGGLTGFCDALEVNRGQRAKVRDTLEELQRWRGGRRDLPPALTYWLKTGSARGRRNELRIQVGEALAPGFATVLKDMDSHPRDALLIPVLPPPSLPSGFSNAQLSILFRLQWELLRRFREDLPTMAERGGWEATGHVRRAAKRVGMDPSAAMRAVDLWMAEEDGWLVSVDELYVALRDPAAQQLFVSAWRRSRERRRLFAGREGNAAT